MNGLIGLFNWRNETISSSWPLQSKDCFGHLNPRDFNSSGPTIFFFSKHNLCFLKSFDGNFQFGNLIYSVHVFELVPPRPKYLVVMTDSSFSGPTFATLADVFSLFALRPNVCVTREELDETPQGVSPQEKRDEEGGQAGQGLSSSISSNQEEDHGLSIMPGGLFNNYHFSSCSQTHTKYECVTRLVERRPCRGRRGGV